MQEDFQVLPEEDQKTEEISTSSVPIHDSTCDKIRVIAFLWIRQGLMGAVSLCNKMLARLDTVESKYKKE